jgi:hypothetical protein
MSWMQVPVQPLAIGGEGAGGKDGDLDDDFFRSSVASQQQSHEDVDYEVRQKRGIYPYPISKLKLN